MGAAELGENGAVPLLPELEAYQARLEDRARTWEESPDAALAADLARCDEQVRLLERSLMDLAAALEALRQREGDAEADEARRKAEHRHRVMSQTRDLTAAYAHVLRGYITRRGPA